MKHGRLTATTLALLGVTVSTAGCGPVPDESETSETSSRAVANECCEKDEPEPTAVQKLVDKLPPGIKIIAGNVKTISALYSDVGGAIQVATFLGQLLGILDREAPNLKLADLKRELDKLGAALDWKMSEQARTSQRARMQFAIDAVRDVLRVNGTLAFNSEAVAAANTAVNEASGDVAFIRYLPDGATAGEWQEIIADRPAQIPDPDAARGQNLMYDWRQGVPQLMALIAQELVVLGAVDVNFKQNDRFDDILVRRRQALRDQYSAMLRGVRCGSKVIHHYGFGRQPYSRPDLSYRSVTCADIHSGTHAITRVNPIQCTGNGYEPPVCTWDDKKIEVAQESMQRTVTLRMPLFEMKSMIDELSTLIHYRNDLTDFRQRITADRDESLCIDVRWASGVSGTPVWLYSCNGGAAQHWVYDRTSGVIRNPSLDRCLDVKWGNALAGSTVWSYECNGGLAQKWTWDPETKVLQSALGTVLWAAGPLQAQTPLWTWHYNIGSEFRWR
jgi:hypothetical protein